MRVLLPPITKSLLISWWVIGLLSLAAANSFSVASINPQEPKNCRSGEILQGLLKPDACPEFSKTCTPDHPLGATMVSSEGACAAYYRYRSHAY